ncbi:MAG: M48 family metallopeptidase [Solirubrobacterales bacterium]|nr:M48 family metallopeptidase [Solirubrobacterales bacterium]
MSQHAPSLRRRVALAIALTIAFHAFALTVGLGLIAAPILGIVLADWANVWLAFFCIATGVTILRAIVPRRAPFEAPGPELRPEAQPRLFEVLRDVAREAGDEPPDAVYLAHDVNASVTEHGRPRRRVLLLGLPLLQALTVDELRAVVAHEHGHYVGGDLRAAAWVWRTRAALFRTLDALYDEERWGRRLVAQPFKWYAKAFLRITNAVSRREELAADALAARVAGTAAQASALRSLAAAAAAFPAYVDDDLDPALALGGRPPIAEGFARFLAVPAVRSATEEHLAQRLAEEQPDPYASHPTLRERLEALGADPVASAEPAAGPRAVDLLDDLPALERGLLREPDELRPLGWEDVGSGLHAPAYAEDATAAAGALGTLTVAGAGDAVRDLTPLARRLAPEDGEAPPEGALEAHAFHLVAGGVVAALHRAGWQVEALPGEPVTCRRGEHAIAPFADLGPVARGDRPAGDWREAVGGAGVGDLPLVPQEEPRFTRDAQPSTKSRTSA